MKNTKICDNCGEKFIRTTQNDWQWEHKITCDVLCLRDKNHKIYKRRRKAFRALLTRYKNQAMKKNKEALIAVLQEAKDVKAI